MANTRYKAQNFSWLGSMSGSDNLLVVWSGTGVKTIDDARKREVIMGALARNGTLATYPLILNTIAGTKFKLVLGYVGSQVIDLAMERGEVEGKGSYSWANLKADHPDWVCASSSSTSSSSLGSRRNPICWTFRSSRTSPGMIRSVLC